MLQQLHIVTQSVMLGVYPLGAGPAHTDHGAPCTEELADAFVDAVTALAAGGQPHDLPEAGHSHFAQGMGHHHGQVGDKARGDAHTGNQLCVCAALSSMFSMSQPSRFHFESCLCPMSI